MKDNLSEHFDLVVEDHLQKMDDNEPGTEETRKTADEIKTLMEAKAYCYSPQKSWKDYVMPIIGTVVPILTILAYEKKDAITSKAFGFVPKK
jgi:hypothetical protein